MQQPDLRIRIEKFKSIDDVEVELRAGLNVLVGPNGSGKTNFLSALKFTRDFVLHGAARAVAFAGGPRSVYNRGSQAVTITLCMPYGERIVRRRKTPVTLTWSFSITQSTGEVPIVQAEQVRLNATRGGEPVELFAMTRNGGRPQKRLSNDDVRGRDLFDGWQTRANNRREQVERVAKYLDELGKAIAGDSDHSMLSALSELDSRIGALLEFLWGLNEYNILPDIARAPGEPSPYAYMRPDGAGMSEVVHALTEGLFYKLEDSRRFDVDQSALIHLRYTRRFYFPGGFPEYIFYGTAPREPRNLGAALDNIRQELVAGVTPIDGITTQLDHNTGKRFVVFTAGHNRFYPNEVSDGTIKWLCILISLFVPRSTIYLLEEPENFLHPWMQQRLVSTMRQQAQAYSTIFFLTSHSTTLLNAATPDELLIVTPTSQGTKIDRLRERAEIDHVLEDSHFGLGDLWVSGAIDGVPQ